jgi:hypothetical protein
MNIMNSFGVSTGHGELSPLRLRLTHNGGEPRDGVLRIPAAGAGMADALEVSGERQSDAQWRLANLCRIAWSHDAGCWQLLNASYTLTCVRNGEPVPAGRAISMGPGDTLELGLMRFVVEQGEEDVPEHGGAGPARTRMGVADARDEDPVPPAFELRDLAGDVDDGGLATGHVEPFDVLGMPGSRSPSTQDVLSTLLAEAPRSGAPTAASMPAGIPRLAPDSPEGLLDELHEEFARVVRDPGQLAGRTDWEGFLAMDSEPAPSLDELRKQAEPYALLRDILQPRESIDRIIDDFEPLAHAGLLDAAEPDEVLSLFAPELARNTVAPLPSLTRREHHQLSPDSHVRIGSARAPIGDGKGDSR